MAFAASVFLPARRPPSSGGLPLRGAALDQLMMFHRAPSSLVPANLRERMHIRAAVVPGPSPWGSANEQPVPAPIPTAHAPTPRTEKASNRYPKTEIDRSADKETWARGKENDAGIIIRHDHIARIHGVDRYIGPAAHHDLRSASQITVPLRLLPHSLDGVHHRLL